MPKAYSTEQAPENDTSTRSWPHLPTAPPCSSAQVPIFTTLNHLRTFSFFLHTDFTALFQMSTSPLGVHESLEVGSSISSACRCSRLRRPLRMCLEQEGRCGSQPQTWMERKHASKFFTDLAQVTSQLVRKLEKKGRIIISDLSAKVKLKYAFFC